ncbi:MAG TPA: glycosyltransferase family 4 protein [Acidimicrobiales bacterium]|nr:glycosyltransferase family 4 protein [Acidimicrobiales bacterium]
MHGSHPAVLQVLASSQRRGAEVFATDLGRALTGRGLDVRSVALVPGGHGAALDVAHLGTRALSPSTLGRLRAEAAGVAVVVAHGSRTLPACALGLLGRPVPFVYRNIGDPGYWSASPGRRLRAGLLLRRARAVAALWPGAAGELSRRYGVPASRIHVIPNGVPAGRFPLVEEPHRLAARRALALAPGGAVAVFVGSLTPEKDVGVAIRALVHLDGVELVVAGDGPERAGLEALAAAVAPGRVRFLGVAAEPASVLAAADVLVLPSRSEGMPGVLIEAGLSGIPVVATAVGGVAEVVVDGQTGRLVPPADGRALAAAVTEVLEAPGALVAAARRRCLDRFELTSVASAWTHLLEEVLG